MPRVRSAFTLFAALSARYETALDHVAPRGPDSPSATTTSAWLDAALTGAKPSKLLRVTSTFFTRVGSSDALDRCVGRASLSHAPAPFHVSPDAHLPYCSTCHTLGARAGCHVETRRTARQLERTSPRLCFHVATAAPRFHVATTASRRGAHRRRSRRGRRRRMLRRAPGRAIRRAPSRASGRRAASRRRHRGLRRKCRPLAYATCATKVQRMRCSLTAAMAGCATRVRGARARRDAACAYCARSAARPSRSSCSSARP